MAAKMIWIVLILVLIIVLNIRSIWQKEAQIEKYEKEIWKYKDRKIGIEAREKETEQRIITKERETALKLAAMESDVVQRLAAEESLHTKKLEMQSAALDEQLRNLEITKSNLTVIPYMAGIIADYETHSLEIFAQKLDWGRSQERAKKVKAIREIRQDAARIVAQSKEAQYQLAYAIQMFPALEDFLNTDYNALPRLELSDIGSDEHDAVRDYLSKEEYSQLSPTERNQLALDRYIASHRKSNWEIGRDYELYVGYKYSQKGYTVEYYGSSNGIEDLGRDLIANNGKETLIIQCKYWGAKKLIHEKHINQLYGTMTCYCFEHSAELSSVHGVLVTNIALSETARRFADYLGIVCVENFALSDFPRIKCNINKDEYGLTTKIYHLPFDQQYDSCKIDSPGEFFAMTVKEAEDAGFRRAYRWYG